MSVNESHWICSYDICHPKRLNKVHRVLCAVGITINYSVFYLTLRAEQFKKLVKQIEKLIHPEDDVRFYRTVALHRAVVIGTLSPFGIQLLNAQGQLL
ncbi:CRISPR-associated endonuclease Cas2 [Acinetobacter indicus]|uniref:CRISPR-associated endonuclease Cas2 n=1 Tax=Acinetobacter indicus TaxID=756892 RepID=UPI000CECDEE7|nr:CRISPR-associated endonuclease Cas2 [Acinetobacter indicus]